MFAMSSLIPDGRGMPEACPPRDKVYVRHVLTHSEYDRGKWKK